MPQTYRVDRLAPKTPEAEAVGLARQMMSADAMTRGDGLERGVRCVILQNDIISVEVIVDRGLDIGAARIRQMPVSWRSPTEIVAPWFLEQRDHEFFRGFSGGLLTTCGLDHIGNPTTRSAERFGYDNRSAEALPMHGRISAIPARMVAYGVDETSAGLEAWVSGTVSQVAVFGEHLTLTRRIGILYGSSRIEVTDRVENRGYAASPLAMMYHVNIGWPIISPGARVHVGGQRVGGDEIADQVEVPRRGTKQKVSVYAVAPDEAGTGSASVRNDDIDGVHSGAVAISWKAAALPSLVRWQVANTAGHYVLALEPSTAIRLDDVQGHAFPSLEPGESRDLGVSIALSRERRA